MSTVDPRTRTRAIDAADERIMDATERLIALHGGAGISDRQIRDDAGQRNNSAISYHFGNRQGLMDAVWHRRLSSVGVRRAAMLDQPLEEMDLMTVLGLYIRPTSAEISSLSPSYWARFNERFLQMQPVNFIPWARTDAGRFDGQIAHELLFSLFERLRNIVIAEGLPAQDAETRVALAARFVTGAFAAWEQSIDIGTRRPEGLQEYSSDLMVMTAGLLRARGTSCHQQPCAPR